MNSKIKHKVDMTGDEFVEFCGELKKKKKFQKSLPMFPTPVPKLPKDWVWSCLSKISERVSVGHVGPTSEFFSNESDGVPFIRSQDVRPGRLMLDGALYIVPSFHERLKKSQLKAGDVLIVRVGANRGDTCDVPQGIGKLNCANVVFARLIEPNRFVTYFFRSSFGREMLLSVTTGSAQGVINTQTVARLPLPVPPLVTQQKIGAILSAYDELIENNQRRIALLEKMAEEIYREWFVRLRFPGYEKVKKVKGVPEGWDVKKLGSVLELCYGKALKDDDRVSGEFHVYGSSGVVGTHNEALVKTPGLIVGRKGNVGSVYWSDRGFFPIDTVYYVKSVLPNSFLYFLLRSMNFINNDAAVPGLNRNQAYSNLFFLPPAQLIKRYVEIADSLFKMKRVFTRKNEYLTSMRDKLLPRLISGKLSVEHLDIRFPPGMEDRS
ncbi:type I restriction enzyme, S subunit [Nitrosomonas ureae]|uniref:Type I restriction enzyme, S subunit n=1 Tax=Nitrosomonas ureae TaxID=44577 RepID=A0A285BZN4_9PROT|nr:restriction endonuclease subunit S [Nitrosomonas ureae]SNX60328.1 type I restriction enzyme, S subunit [Nitrosomonas ureae]